MITTRCKKPLERSTKPLKRTPIKRSTTQVNRRRPGPARRVSVVRDTPYKIDLVSREGCSVGNQIHRIASRGKCDPAHGPVNGMSSKGGDDGIITLCRLHHEEQHALTWPVFEAKYGIDRAAIAAEHYARYKQEQSK